MNVIWTGIRWSTWRSCTGRTDSGYLHLTADIITIVLKSLNVIFAVVLPFLR